MSDTRKEIAMEKWYMEHIGRCGTCYFREGKYCGCFDSPLHGDNVTYEDGCDEYRAEKGFHI